jgi:hypothetical protein
MVILASSQYSYRYLVSSFLRAVFVPTTRGRLLTPCFIANQQGFIINKGGVLKLVPKTIGFSITQSTKKMITRSTDGLSNPQLDCVYPLVPSGYLT